MRTGNLLIYSAAEIFSDWPRALPRCRRCRASCGRAIEQFDATLARQRATYDEILVQQQAEFEQRYAALRDELFAKIDNELGPVIATLRRELAAANAELARLRAAQPAH